MKISCHSKECSTTQNGLLYCVSDRVCPVTDLEACDSPYHSKQARILACVSINLHLPQRSQILPTITDSPVLQRLGLTSEQVLDGDGKPVKACEWVKQRIIKNLGAGTGSAKGDNEESDVETVKSVKIKYYG